MGRDQRTATSGPRPDATLALVPVAALPPATISAVLAAPAGGGERFETALALVTCR